MAFNLRLCLAFLLLQPLSLSFPAAANKVPLALYYETLCPYSANFIVNYLANVFKNGLLDIVDLKLVPYGNARLGANDSISCQHGPYECLLNTVEACAINIWPDVHVHFSFILCVESLVVEGKYTEWESCFQKTGLVSRLVEDCYTSGYGQKLELQYAAETSALEPPHTYVPWVVVDGHPLYEVADLKLVGIGEEQPLTIRHDRYGFTDLFTSKKTSSHMDGLEELDWKKKDYEHFETYICEAYNGPLPEACKARVEQQNKSQKTHALVSFLSSSSTGSASSY